MAFSNHRANFRGTLEGVEVSELRELDFNRATLADRRSFLEEKYKKVSKFYESYIFTQKNPKGEYISEFYKVNVSSKDELSENINIFKICERDGSYLLNSLDIPKSSQQKYKILDSQEFKKLLNKERLNLSLEQSDVMEVLLSKQGNNYLSRDLIINKNDFEDKDIGYILNQYNELVLILKADMDKLRKKEEAKFDLGFLKRNLASLKSDMLDTKKILKNVKNPAKRLGDESGMFYSDLIDYSNPEHIKAILRNVKLFRELEPDSDLSHIAYDVERALKELHKRGKLDKLDLEIAECVNSGYSERDIAEELNKGKTTIQQRIRKICNRVSKFYEKV